MLEQVYKDGINLEDLNNALNNVRRFEIEQIAPKWKSLFDSLL